jgi:hypothetical protein
MSLGTHDGNISLIATDPWRAGWIERVIIPAAQVKFCHGQQPLIDPPRLTCG